MLDSPLFSVSACEIVFFAGCGQCATTPVRVLSGAIADAMTGIVASSLEDGDDVVREPFFESDNESAPEPREGKLVASASPLLSVDELGRRANCAELIKADCGRALTNGPVAEPVDARLAMDEE